VAETGQLAVDAPVPPRRVLRSQALDQGPQTSRGRWATRWPGCCRGPLPGDQAPMPAQDRPRRHQHAHPSRRWQPQCQHGDDHPVRPRQPGPSHLAPQHRELMAQDENLGVLRRVRTGQQRQSTAPTRRQTIRYPRRNPTQRSSQPKRVGKTPAQQRLRASFWHPQPPPPTPTPGPSAPTSPGKIPQPRPAPLIEEDHLATDMGVPSACLPQPRAPPRRRKSRPGRDVQSRWSPPRDGRVCGQPADKRSGGQLR
jgi:hypothetical protein